MTENRSEIILENLPLNLILVDEAGLITYCNSKFQETVANNSTLFSELPDELTGASITLFSSDNQEKK